MSARTAELETVEYKIPDLVHVTNRLIHDIGEYSGIPGTNNWQQFWYKVLILIHDQTGFDYLWVTRGAEIQFSYFLDPRPKIVDSKVVFASPEPRVVFIERPEFVSPPVRTHIGRVINAITEEMNNVYRLRIERDPTTLVFPKQEYAKTINICEVPLLVA